MSAAPSLFALSRKVVLVTGASSGLGRHFARTLALNGARIAVCARRVDRLQLLVEELEGSGVSRGDICAVGMDVCDEESVKRAVGEAEATLGPIQVLINNAGVASDKPTLRSTRSEWDRVMSTNLTGPWLVAQVVARGMVKHKTEGSIVNIASVAGLRASSNMAGYAASKAGLVHLTKCLALEWARYGIRVNAICPGYIVTDMNRDFFESGAGNHIIQATPQRRLGTPEDLDGLLLLLSSGASSFMTGSILSADGGLLVSSL
jgi:NAD(P)-dependent dehydrogenase (short-subunit alcohol dehydrogenase family)